VNDANPHVSNIGKMVEDMEIKLRTTIEQIYFGKTKDIVNELRQVTSVAIMNQRKDLQRQIGSTIGKNN
jgi:capping protein beta